MSMTVDIKIPAAWHELTYKQAKVLFTLRAVNCDNSAVTFKTILFFRMTGIRILGRDNEEFLCARGNDRFCLSPSQVSAALSYLDWLDSLPQFPWRPDKIGGRTPIPADFDGVPFETYLCADNFFQGYLHTSREDLFHDFTVLLVPGLRRKLRLWEREALTVWFAALKQWLSRKFPDLFVPSSAKSLNVAAVPRMMDSMIRALSGGDVTKEAQVLAADTLRALAELNAKAADYKALNKKLSK